MEMPLISTSLKLWRPQGRTQPLCSSTSTRLISKSCPHWSMGRRCHRKSRYRPYHEKIIPGLNHGRNPEGCTSTADSWRDYQRDWGYFAEPSSQITPDRFDATAGQKKMLHLSFSHKQASILQLGWNTIYRSSMCDFC